MGWWQQRELVKRTTTLAFMRNEYAEKSCCARIYEHCAKPAPNALAWCLGGGDWDGRCPWTQQGFLWRNTGLFSLTGVWQDDHSHLCVCHSTSMCIILAVWGQNMAPKIQKRFFTYTEHLTSVSVPWIKKKKQTKEMVLKVETGLHLQTLFLVYFSWGKTHYRPI